MGLIAGIENSRRIDAKEKKWERQRQKSKNESKEKHKASMKEKYHGKRIERKGEEERETYHVRERRT